MAYTKTTWVNGTAPAINATNLNKIEDGVFNNDAAITALDTEVNTGWLALGATLTYNSTDAPNYIVDTSISLVNVISLGMRIKLTHAVATKYFIVVAVSATQLTLYGGTDYTLAATAITAPFFSQWEAPFGFPLSPLKWTVSALNSGVSQSTSTPTGSTWYNALSFSVPIGSWVLEEKLVFGTTRSTVGETTIYTTIGTTSAAAGLPELTHFARQSNNAASLMSVYGTFTGSFVLTLVAKTTYYLNYRTLESGIATLYIRGDLVPTIVNLVCAYL